MAKKYAIKITGSGTLEEIYQALLNVTNDITSTMFTSRSGDLELSNDFQREDPTLFTEIIEEESGPFDQLG